MIFQAKKIMKKWHLLFIALTLMPSPAWAGWQLVSETRESILYIDLDSAQKNGQLVQAESSQDFHLIQKLVGHAYLSAKFINEYDCEKKQLRQISLTIFPENMANGDILFSEKTPQDWAPLQPGSTGEALWQQACGKS